MKTTLKYKVLETLRRQPAWKRFIENLVDECNELYDDNLVAKTDTTANGKLMTEVKLNDSEDNLAAQYAILGYLRDVMHLNLRENISLRGLLRTLSLYGCRIEDIVTDGSELPHTYKVTGGNKDSDVWGYDHSNTLDDEEARAVGAEGESSQEYIDGDVESDYYEYLVSKNYDEEDTSFRYIRDLYGYNQKNPILTVSEIKEVRWYYRFEKGTESGTPSSLPQYLYIQENAAQYSSYWHVTTPYAFKIEDIEYSGVVPCDDSDTAVTTEVEDNNGGTHEEPMTLEAIINEYYLSGADDPVLEKKWVSVQSADSVLKESAFIVNDTDTVDLFDEHSRIKYNSFSYDDENDRYTLEAKLAYNNVRLATSEDATINKVTLRNVGIIGKHELYIGDKNSTVYPQMKFVVYEDSLNNKQWVIMDTKPTSYQKLAISNVKSQLYADECKIKAQPLFLYEGKDGEQLTSTCANFIDASGGVGAISYEVERVKTSNTNYVKDVKNNESGGNTAVGVSYGKWFNKWEQYSVVVGDENREDIDGNRDRGFLIQDVYTDKYFPTDEAFYFLNGTNKRFLCTEKESNDVKVSGDKIYENTFRQEFFETMFFNHFVKVYPVGVNDGDGVVQTTQLACDDLDLVEFGDIEPYVVSYDRIGVQSDGNGLRDIDCSVFSKVVSYNKHTKLLLVNNPVVFQNAHTPKYVVIAYRHASPFNNLKELNIVAPNDAVKQVVGNILEDYVNSSCKLSLFSKSEYDVYKYEQDVEQQLKDHEREVNEFRKTLKNKNGGSKYMFGTYDARAADGKDIKIWLEIYGMDGSWIIEADTNNGFFEFTVDSSGYIQQKRYLMQTVNLSSTITETNNRLSVDGFGRMGFCDQYRTMQNGAYVNVKVEGCEYITSIYFSNSIQYVFLGEGFFEPLKSLRVIENLKCEYHWNTVNDRTNAAKLWSSAEFSKLPNLMYFNPSAMDARMRLVSTSYTTECAMFRGTKIRTMDFSTIDFGVTDSYIDINFDNMFNDCLYLEYVNFRLKNGNKFRAVSANRMFKNCRFLKTVDLGAIDFSGIKSAASMFEGCERLEEVEVDWGENAAENKVLTSMFKNCTRLKEYGSFSGWSFSGAVLTSMFENSGIKELEWLENSSTSPLPKSLSPSRVDNMLTGSAVESLNVKFLWSVDVTNGRMSGLQLPSLTTIVNCGNLTCVSNWGTSTNTNPTAFVIDTPMLTVDGLYAFIQQQSTTLKTDSNYLLLGVNDVLFKKLRIDTDIVYDTINNCYYFINYPYVRIERQH